MERKTIIQANGNRHSKYQYLIVPQIEGRYTRDYLNCRKMIETDQSVKT